MRASRAACSACRACGTVPWGRPPWTPHTCGMHQPVPDEQPKPFQAPGLKFCAVPCVCTANPHAVALLCCFLLPLQASAASGRGVVALFSSLFSSVLSRLPQMDHSLLQCAAQEAAAACQAEGLAQLKLAA